MNLLAARLPALLAACASPFLCFPEPVHGQGDAACPTPALAPVLRKAPNRDRAPVLVRADTLDARKAGLGQIAGNVELERADQYLRTEILNYRPDTRVVSLPKPLVYRDVQVELQAADGTYSLNSESGQFNDVRFGIVGSTANGAAAQVRIVAGNRSELEGVRFTTCPGDDPEWELSARELEFRHDEGIGIARGAKLELVNVPVLYVPWISFPIDDRRKSGFLYPFIGSANDIGLEFGIPYYWNIAPNQDATFTPRVYTDRGVMLSSQYRLLTRRTGGTVDFDFLPDDDDRDRDRWRYQARFKAALNPHWRASANLERVSDDAYFQDFGDGLAQTARQYLRSDAGIDGAGRYWIFSMLFDDFQVIDDSVNRRREPYRRVPRMAFTLDAPLGRGGLQTDLDAELVYFDRSTGITGARADIYPALVWNRNRYWGFFRASAGYRYTAYNLDLAGATGDEQPDRGLEILSVDSGLYLEKTLENGDRQTLEPRLFYLYVPFEEQSSLPDFDTGDFTFGFAQLFHYNRFTGADRQSDANRITLAASTRTISNSTGRETWSLHLGQIMYVQSPRITLDEQPTQDIDTSPFIAELNWHPLDRISTRLGIQWNWENRELDVGVVGLDRRGKDGSRLGFEYRFRRDRLDQIDLRYYRPISQKWRFYSRLNYSLEDSDLLEAMVGVEYESCCWALRLVTRRYLKDRAGGERDAIYLELRLKGLGSFGRRPPPLFYTPADS